MERGQLASDRQPATLFVFEGLLAKLTSPRIEKQLLRLRRFEAALDCWEFDYRVCDYVESCMSRYLRPVEIITWRPHGFARVLADRLWTMDIPVRDVIAGGDYRHLSQQIAVDDEVMIVYDPEHTSGYGWKAREFDIGRYY